VTAAFRRAGRVQAVAAVVAGAAPRRGGGVAVGDGVLHGQHGHPQDRGGHELLRVPCPARGAGCGGDPGIVPAGDDQSVVVSPVPDPHPPGLAAAQRVDRAAAAAPAAGAVRGRGGGAVRRVHPAAGSPAAGGAAGGGAADRRGAGAAARGRVHPGRSGRGPAAGEREPGTGQDVGAHGPGRVLVAAAAGLGHYLRDEESTPAGRRPCSGCEPALQRVSMHWVRVAACRRGRPGRIPQG
jgi:hypothetical protein